VREFLEVLYWHRRYPVLGADSTGVCQKQIGICKDTHLFDRLLRGYQRGLFECAARQAGARKVIFAT
jgi:hypothetical protein